MMKILFAPNRKSTVPGLQFSLETSTDKQLALRMLRGSDVRTLGNSSKFKSSKFKVKTKPKANPKAR